MEGKEKMDPITSAIIAALANLSSTVIKDAYDALKTVINRKWGADSQLSKAVKNLEEKPDSSGRKEVLQEEVKAANADQEPQLHELAQAIFKAVESLQAQTSGSTTISQKAGDNAVQIGQLSGDVNIKR